MVNRLGRFLIVFVLLATVSAVAVAQDTIPFVPSPPHVVQRMLEVAEIKNGDVLYDMGSGDGRIVIEAAKKFGVRGVGIDLNPGRRAIAGGRYSPKTVSLFGGMTST